MDVSDWAGLELPWCENGEFRMDNEFLGRAAAFLIGNNKSDQECFQAIDVGVGELTIVGMCRLLKMVGRRRF